jgi:ATP-dependent exoDNAse (exonuclease V) alpha subunit
VVVATLKQLPVISGYALTFHKSQGMTFDRICVAPLIFSGDSGNGMLYIALSRVKSIKDIFLLSPIKEDCLRKITAVENFLSETTTPSELTFEEEQELQQYS